MFGDFIYKTNNITINILCDAMSDSACAAKLILSILCFAASEVQFKSEYLYYKI